MAEPLCKDNGDLTVVGIDVGGARKGFHAVALRDGGWADQLHSRNPEALAVWCRRLGAQLIAVDAPCRWSPDGRMRPCEREMLAGGIRCFASPSRARALSHPSNWFGWMLQGEALYGALEQEHPLCRGLPLQEPCCFETFPHAITWHLRRGDADAAHKREQRRQLLAEAGVPLSTLTSLDWIDAAVCALAAQRIGRGEACVAYGEPDSGLILVPALAPAAEPPLSARVTRAEAHRSHAGSRRCSPG